MLLNFLWWLSFAFVAYLGFGITVAAINKLKVAAWAVLLFIIFRQKTPTQQVGWGMNGAGFEHIVLQPLMRLLHNCQHSSFCSKSFLWKGIDPN